LKGRKTIKINLNEDKNKHCRYTNTEVINPRDPNPVPIKKKKNCLRRFNKALNSSVSTLQNNSLTTKATKEDR
jgi:hypothetical protein